MSLPYLHKVSFEFSQENNTDGTTGSDGEDLIIEVISAPSSLLECMGYLVLNTPTGWSINDSDELKQLIDTVTNSINVNIKT